MLNTLTLENEKLSGEGFKNKSKVPRCLLHDPRAEISYVPMKNIFRGDIRNLCSQGTQRTDKFGFFLRDYTVHDQFFILNVPELIYQIYSCCSYLKIVDFNGAFKKLSLEIYLNKIRRQRLE